MRATTQRFLVLSLLCVATHSAQSAETATPVPSRQECEDPGTIQRVKTMLDNLEKAIEPISPEQVKYMKRQSDYTLAHGQVEEHNALIRTLQYRAMRLQDAIDRERVALVRALSATGSDKSQIQVNALWSALSLDADVNYAFQNYPPAYNRDMSVKDQYSPFSVTQGLLSAFACWAQRGAAAP